MTSPLLLDELAELQARVNRAETLAEIRRRRILDPGNGKLREDEAFAEENLGTLAQRVESIAERALLALTPDERDAELKRRRRKFEGACHG